jgi:hypothetical protein
VKWCLLLADQISLVPGFRVDPLIRSFVHLFISGLTFADVAIHFSHELRRSCL